MNKYIWQSFIQLGKQSRNTITQLQVDEINYIDLIFKERLLALGFRTSSKDSVYKTQYGYSLKRVCVEQNCSLNWLFKVNVPDGDGIISRNGKCNHLKN